MKKDFEYSEDYKARTMAEQAMLDDIAEIMFTVQYSEMGHKTAARREAAFLIVDSIKRAYKTYRRKSL